MTQGSASPPDASPSGHKTSTHYVFPVLILCALLALALNLRSPLTAIPPVIHDITRDLGIGSTMAGLMTSIPVLCFGILTPLASILISRTGILTAIYITLAGISIGLVLRPYTGLDGMLGGTLLIGASLAIGNILCLMIIARDFPRHMSIVTGLYTAAMNVGTMLTGALTAPLASVINWRFALASWIWMAALAWLLWRHVNKRYHYNAQPRPPAASASTSASKTSLRQRPIIWLLALALCIHLFVYYAITAWLPAFLIETDGMNTTQAGLVASTFQILALIGSFGVPLVVRFFPLGLQLSAMGILWMITPILMLVFPKTWLLWALTGGIAQGGTFVVIFMCIMQHATDLDDNRRLSSIIQSVAYALASLGPIFVGALHESLGQWTAPYLLLSLLSFGLVIIGRKLGKLPFPDRKTPIKQEQG